MLGVSGGYGHDQSHKVGHLGGGPQGELVGAPVVVGYYSAALHGVGDQALVDDALAYRHFGLARRRLDVAAPYLPFPGDVIGGLGVELGRTAPGGLLCVHHGGQGLIVHIHHSGGVYRGGGVIGYHDGHGFTREPGGVKSHCRAGGVRYAREEPSDDQGARLGLQVRPREHAHDSGQVPGSGDVHASDTGMGVGAPHDRGV